MLFADMDVEHDDETLEIPVASTSGNIPSKNDSGTPAPMDKMEEYVIQLQVELMVYIRSPDNSAADKSRAKEVQKALMEAKRVNNGSENLDQEAAELFINAIEECLPWMKKSVAISYYVNRINKLQQRNCRLP